MSRYPFESLQVPDELEKIADFDASIDSESVGGSPPMAIILALLPGSDPGGRQTLGPLGDAGHHSHLLDRCECW